MISHLLFRGGLKAWKFHAATNLSKSIKSINTQNGIKKMRMFFIDFFDVFGSMGCCYIFYRPGHLLSLSFFVYCKICAASKKFMHFYEWKRELIVSISKSGINFFSLLSKIPSKNTNRKKNIHTNDFSHSTHTKQARDLKSNLRYLYTMAFPHFETFGQNITRHKDAE